jgi:hypothetical protein
MAAINDANQVEKVQNIRKVIFNIQSEQTPLLSMIDKGEDSSQALFEATLEKNPRAAFDGVADGVDVSSYDGVPRVKIGAYCQEYRRPFKVSQRADNTETNALAKKKELARQKVKALVILKQMMEASFCSNTEAQADTGAGTTPYLTRGAFPWMSVSAQAVLPVPSGYRPASDAVLDGTTLAAVTEAAMATVLDALSIARQGGELELHGFVGLKLKDVFDKFGVYADAGASFGTFPVRSWQQERGVVMRQVNKLAFSSGTVWLHRSVYLMRNSADGEDTAYTPRSGLFLDMDYWSTRWQLKPETVDQIDAGGGPRGYVRAMAGLDCKSPQSSTYITAAS